MMIRQEKPAGPEPDILRLQERLGHEEIGRRMRLPGRRVVLADPGLLVAELIGPPQHLEVPLVAVVEAALRGM